MWARNGLKIYNHTCPFSYASFTSHDFFIVNSRWRFSYKWIPKNDFMATTRDIRKLSNMIIGMHLLWIGYWNFYFRWIISSLSATNNWSSRRLELLCGAVNLMFVEPVPWVNSNMIWLGIIIYAIEPCGILAMKIDARQSAYMSLQGPPSWLRWLTPGELWGQTNELSD